MVSEIMKFIAQQDEEVGVAILKEYERQSRNLELIASENIVSEASMLAMGSVLTNKYAEGYPGKRYYGGCEDVDIVETLAQDDEVNGILVQLPLPEHINEEKIIQTISPAKDVDGFHMQNVGALCVGGKGYVSCTPLGIIELLKRSGIEIAGKRCVVMGRSNIVGKPMALLLLRENGTVTVCHSKTQDMREITRQADILVVAIGKPKFVDESYIKEGAVVIDVGIHRNAENKLCGDVDFEKVAPHTSAITPVPGGVGPMTIAMLMNNCVSSVE